MFSILKQNLCNKIEEYQSDRTFSTHRRIRNAYKMLVGKILVLEETV
jgi:hypothetical protein